MNGGPRRLLFTHSGAFADRTTKVAAHPAAMPSKKKTALPCGDNLMLCFPSLQMVNDANAWAVEPAATLPINTSNNLAKLN